MPQIRPVSDLQHRLAEITRIVHENKEPVFLTRDGYGDMVVMSMEQYEEIHTEGRIRRALLDAQHQAEQDNTRYDAEEVFSRLRSKLEDRQNELHP